MRPLASRVAVHLAGEGKAAIALATLPVKLTVTCTDEALTPCGGLAARSGFRKHLGIIEQLADHCPVARTSPNAAPVREGLHRLRLAKSSAPAAARGLQTRDTAESDSALPVAAAPRQVHPWLKLNEHSRSDCRLRQRIPRRHGRIALGGELNSTTDKKARA